MQILAAIFPPVQLLIKIIIFAFAKSFPYRHLDNPLLGKHSDKKTKCPWKRKFLEIAKITGMQVDLEDLEELFAAKVHENDVEVQF